MNRYTLARDFSNYITDLCKRYKIINNDVGINVNFIFEKHLMDRIIDRKIEDTTVKRCIEKIIKFKVCELIYLCESSGKDHTRVLCRYRDYVVGVTMCKTRNGNYRAKINTIYLERKRVNGREISTFEIDITN